MTDNAQASANFMQATVLSVAKAIAAQFCAGEMKAASDRLEQHLGELSAADGARFISTVKGMIEKG